MSDRYYVFLDDIESCFRDTYKIGDRVYEKYLKKSVDAELANDYYIKQFEADQEDEARAYCDRLNSDWNTATKETLAVRINDLEEVLEDTESHRDHLDRDLRKALALIVRLHHNQLVHEGSRDILFSDVDEGLEEFFTPLMSEMLEQEMHNIARDNGLNVHKFRALL